MPDLYHSSLKTIDGTGRDPVLSTTARA
jgi:hypothetical protein